MTTPYSRKMRQHLDSTCGTNLFASVSNKAGDIFYIQCRSEIDDQPLTYRRFVGEGGVVTLEEIDSLYTWALYNGVIGELVTLNI